MKQRERERENRGGRWSRESEKRGRERKQKKKELFSLFLYKTFDLSFVIQIFFRAIDNEEEERALICLFRPMASRGEEEEREEEVCKREM